ncbi:MAG: MarR family transcriptional regulator [Gemmatimonadaceae bacterium]
MPAKKRVKLNTTFEIAEDSPGFLLWKAANALQRSHAESLRDLDITTTQFSLLTCLVYLQQSGDVTASRMVAHTGMDKMLVSDLLAALTKKQLVRRVPNPADARSSLVRATASGQRVTNAALQIIEALDADFFSRVKNLKTLQAALRILIREPDSA